MLPRLHLLFLAFAALVLSFLLLIKPAYGARPNIIVIQTDDQSTSSLRAVYPNRRGQDRRAMPQTLERVFKLGAEFTNAYVASPLCSPSRAAILTGQYPHNNGLSANEGANGGWTGWQALPIAENNIPVMLQRSGYHTAHLGKFTNSYWNNNSPERIVPSGWDDWFTTSFLSGEARYYGYMLNDNGLILGPMGRKNYSLTTGVDSKKCTVTKRTAIRGCNHLTDVVTRRATKIIGQTERPLYMHIDYQAPHGDSRAPIGPQPASRHTFSAARAQLPLDSSFNEADLSDKPQFLQNSLPLLSRSDRRVIKRSWQRVLESLRAVDQGVEAIIDALRKKGVLNNTFIVFTSDNGLFFGQHRVPSGKSLPYEPAARVPLAIRGPGITAEKIPTPVSNIDLGATFLDIADARPSYLLDGLPIFEAAERRNRGVLLSMDGGGSRLGFRALRLGDYKFVRYRNGEEELYNLRTDRQELNNLAASPQYRELRLALATELQRLEACAGASCQRESSLSFGS